MLLLYAKPTSNLRKANARSIFHNVRFHCALFLFTLLVEAKICEA